MSVPVRIDAEAFSDPRIEVLASLAGYNRHEALGRLALLWAYCTKRQTLVVDASIVEGSLACSADAFVRSGLGESVESGIRVRGLEGRIEWYTGRVAASRAGGEANRARWARLRAGEPVASHMAIHPANENEAGEPNDSHMAIHNGAKREPNDSPLTLTLTPTLTISEEEEEKTPRPPKGASSESKSKRGRKPKPWEPTEAEREAAHRILGKLGKQNGVRYSGSDAHVMLIARQLRDGIDEMDLRYVVAYCAEEMGWRDHPKMHGALRPETLFGPQTINKYIDGARTMRAREEADKKQTGTPYAPLGIADLLTDWRDS